MLIQNLTTLNSTASLSLMKSARLPLWSSTPRPSQQKFSITAMFTEIDSSDQAMEAINSESRGRELADGAATLEKRAGCTGPWVLGKRFHKHLNEEELDLFQHRPGKDGQTTR